MTRANRFRFLGFALVLSTSVAAVATTSGTDVREAVDEEIVARIKTEAFQRSHVMEVVRRLADHHGPRLGGSPEFAAAASWARDRLAALGAADARLEPFEQEGPGWTLVRFSAEMTAPRYLRLVAEPEAWSPAIAGTLSGTPVLVNIGAPADFDAHRGKLKGAIVLNGRPGTPPPDPELPSGRYSDEELARRERQIDPGARGFGPFTPESYEAARDAAAKRRAAAREIADFFANEGIAALITPNRVPGLLVSADGTAGRLAAKRFPTFVLAAEHWLAQVPEGRKIFSRLTVLENLEMGAFVRNDKPGFESDKAKVFTLFPILKERQSQLGGTLSGGEQQMLAIGRALMCRPRMLLMDEPSMGIAPMLVLRIFDAVRALNQEGMTVLLVEQNARQALKLAHRGYVLENGRIVMTDDAAKLAESDEVRKAYLGVE